MCVLEGSLVYRGSLYEHNKSRQVYPHFIEESSINNHRNDQSFIEGSSIRGEDGTNPEWYALRESGCHRHFQGIRESGESESLGVWEWRCWAVVAVAGSM